MQTSLFDLSPAAARTGPAAAPAELPTSSVPAALDRGHLYSPRGPEVADHRPGDLYGPLPRSRPGAAWRGWWDAEASVPTPDYLGLRAGDVITVQHPCTVESATVVSTCRFGALVRYPLPPCDWSTATHAEQYVTARNPAGHWYR
ncbi:hypothetical protein ACFW6R_29715 [Streptomyces albidoflavus]